MYARPGESRVASIRKGDIKAPVAATIPIDGLPSASANESTSEMPMVVRSASHGAIFAESNRVIKRHSATHGLGFSARTRHSTR